ncbi:MAG TPA: hypothetical protein V6D08_07050 [Candidatus Obscuribacterales bacterium]
MLADVAGYRARKCAITFSSIVALACLLSLAAYQAAAQSGTGGGSGAGVTGNQTLTGKVVILKTAAGIKAMGECAHKLKRAALDMIGELQRQDLVVVSEPDVIGPIIVPAVPNPSGMMPVGDYLPPRKKWLDFYMAQMSQLIPLMQSELADTAIPADKKDAIKGPWGQMQSLVQDMQSHYKALQPLTQGPSFDRDAIGKEVLAIYDDVEELDKLRKQVFHIIKEKS